MSAAWIAASVILAVIVAVLAVVFYSFCCAVRRVDDLLDERTEARYAYQESEGEAYLGAPANLLLIVIAVAIFAAAQVCLEGPTEHEASAHIAGAVGALDAPRPAAEPVRPQHATATAPARRRHVSVLADAR